MIGKTEAIIRVVVIEEGDFSQLRPELKRSQIEEAIKRGVNFGEDFETVEIIDVVVTVDGEKVELKED